MSNIIDRRLNPKDKNLKNRQKFIQRSREQIKEAVRESIDNGNIADIESGKIRVRVKGVSEPSFDFNRKTGNKKYVMPGNDQYQAGDTEPKPKQNQGGGGSQGGLGKSESDIEFVLDPSEYMDFIFEDLELPDMVKKQIKDVTKLKAERAGFTNTGNPSQLDVVRSLKNSIGRRIGLRRPTNEEIELLEQQLQEAQQQGLLEEVSRLEELIAQQKRRQISIPWLDPVDVRYRNFTLKPQPITSAVMFCVMDVSGSMGQKEKDIAKRFFFLLHMFLNRKYEKVDIVFIMHHEEATEVDEHEFFHSKESGGTVVSSALTLTKKIIDERYNPELWNIYVAQASDGDNYREDEEPTAEAMASLLPLTQYFAYIEVKNNYSALRSMFSDLWDTYYEIAKTNKALNMKQVQTVSDIWKVFRELFSKERVTR